MKLMTRSSGFKPDHDYFCPMDHTLLRYSEWGDQDQVKSGFFCNKCGAMIPTAEMVRMDKNQRTKMESEYEQQ